MRRDSAARERLRALVGVAESDYVRIGHDGRDLEPDALHGDHSPVGR